MCGQGNRTRDDATALKKDTEATHSSAVIDENDESVQLVQSRQTWMPDKARARVEVTKPAVVGLSPGRNACVHSMLVQSKGVTQDNTAASNSGRSAKGSRSTQDSCDSSASSVVVTKNEPELSVLSNLDLALKKPVPISLLNRNSTAEDSPVIVSSNSLASAMKNGTGAKGSDTGLVDAVHGTSDVDRKIDVDNPDAKLCEAPVLSLKVDSRAPGRGCTFGSQSSPQQADSSKATPSSAPGAPSTSTPAGYNYYYNRRGEGGQATKISISSSPNTDSLSAVEVPASVLRSPHDVEGKGTGIQESTGAGVLTACRTDLPPGSIDSPFLSLPRHELAAIRNTWPWNARLLRLPPELRNMIYELAVPRDLTIRNTLRAQFEVIERGFRFWEPSEICVITQVCRLLRKETMAFFYSSHTYTFNSERALPYAHQEWSTSQGRLQRWLSHLSPTVTPLVEKLYIRGYHSIRPFLFPRMPRWTEAQLLTTVELKNRSLSVQGRVAQPHGIREEDECNEEWLRARAVEHVTRQAKVVHRAGI